MKTTRKNPREAGGKPRANAKANTIAHLRVTRDLAKDELAESYSQSAKLNHPITVDEAVAVVPSPNKNAPEGISAAPELNAGGVSGTTGMTAASALQAQKKKVANETVKNLYLSDISEWNKHAAELKTNLGAQIGTFAAMHAQVEQVRKDHSALKDAIRKGTVPADTRIMPEVEWTAK